MVGRLRLWSGYVLFAYVTTHLLNHSLGLISLRVIEAGRIWFVYAWQSLPGQALLYGALLVHFSLALWAIMRRRSTATVGLGMDPASRSACRSVSRWLQSTSSAHGSPRSSTMCTPVSVGPGLPRVGQLDRAGPPVRPDLRRLDPRLHRPALRLAPAAVVPRLAARALRRGAARSGGRHRWCGDRLARCRRARHTADFLPNLFDRLQAPNAEGVATLYMIADTLIATSLLLLAAAFAARPVRDLWERRAGAVHLATAIASGSICRPA
jgi:adenylate cyclase